MSDDARRFAPSTARNRDFIRNAFLKTMPREGAILEVGSGAGEHCVHLASAAPALRFLPGDPDPGARQSISAWIAHSGLQNIAPPHAADMSAPGWHEDFAPCDGVLSINMIHIAPFSAAEGLFAGASALLTPRGRLFLYGPFKRNGEHTAPSNVSFEEWLKEKDDRFGVRDLDLEIAPLADRSGMQIRDVFDMPANNLSVVFERR